MKNNRKGCRTSRKNLRRGQAMLEYILLMACLSVVSIGFAKFASGMIFSGPLQNGKLPNKVATCLSHQKSLATQCN